MEEIYSMLILSKEHSLKLLNLENKKQKVGLEIFILIIAGENGVLRSFQINMIGKDHKTFQCLPLFQLEVIKSLQSNITNTNETSNKLSIITSLLYLTNQSEIIAVSTDYNFYVYSM